jgi:hypothetical protein
MRVTASDQDRYERRTPWAASSSRSPSTPPPATSSPSSPIPPRCPSGTTRSNRSSRPQRVGPRPARPTTTPGLCPAAERTTPSRSSNTSRTAASRWKAAPAPPHSATARHAPTARRRHERRAPRPHQRRRPSRATRPPRSSCDTAVQTRDATQPRRTQADHRVHDLMQAPRNTYATDTARRGTNHPLGAGAATTRATVVSQTDCVVTIAVGQLAGHEFGRSIPSSDLEGRHGR